MYVDRDDMYFGNDRLVLGRSGARRGAQTAEGRGAAARARHGEEDTCREQARHPGGCTGGDRDRDAAPQRSHGAGDEPWTNTLTAAEKKDGWELLFDGKTLDAWRGYKMQTIPAGWTVEDGAIRFVPPKDAAGGAARRHHHQEAVPGLRAGGRVGGHARRQQRHLVSRERDKPRTYETGPEFQVLDNAGHQDGKKPVTSAGSNYALHAPVKDVTRPLGEWNEARIRSRARTSRTGSTAPSSSSTTSGRRSGRRWSRPASSRRCRATGSRRPATSRSRTTATTSCSATSRSALRLRVSALAAQSIAS